MKSYIAAGLAAGALAMAASAAVAEDFTLDLKKVDPHTAQGQAAVQAWESQVADAYCGPVDMPQPLDLVASRKSCRIAVKADSEARINAAQARNGLVRYKVASR